jgi:hypothetical protein
MRRSTDRNGSSAAGRCAPKQTLIGMSADADRDRRQPARKRRSMVMVGRPKAAFQMYIHRSESAVERSTTTHYAMQAAVHFPSKNYTSAL